MTSLPVIPHEAIDDQEVEVKNESPSMLSFFCFQMTPHQLFIRISHSGDGNRSLQQLNSIWHRSDFLHGYFDGFNVLPDFRIRRNALIRNMIRILQTLKLVFICYGGPYYTLLFGEVYAGGDDRLQNIMNISLFAICLSMNILDAEFVSYNQKARRHHFHWLRAFLYPPVRKRLGLEKPRPIFRLHRLIRFVNYIQPRWLFLGQSLSVFFVVYVFSVALFSIYPWWLFIVVTCPGNVFFFMVLVYCIWPSLVTLFAIYSLAAGIVFIALDTKHLDPKPIHYRCVREMITIITFSHQCNRMLEHTLATFDSGNYMLFVISSYVGLFSDSTGILLSFMLLAACFGTFILMIYPTFFVNELLTNRLSKFKMRVYSQCAAQIYSTRMLMKMEVILNAKAEFTFFSIFRYSHQALVEVSRRKRKNSTIKQSRLTFTNRF